MRAMALHFARLLPLRGPPAPFDLAPVLRTMAWPHLEHPTRRISGCAGGCGSARTAEGREGVRAEGR